MNSRQEATKIIALTLATHWGEETPSVNTWRHAKALVEEFEAAGHIDKEDNCTVCGKTYDGICYPDPKHAGYSYCGRK